MGESEYRYEGNPRYYVCKRARLYLYLKSLGFNSLYAFQNEQRLLYWVYEKTDKLKEALDDYFGA